MRNLRVLMIIIFCFLSVGAQTNPLKPMVTENGFINLSLDALGTNNTAGENIQVNKPINATVKKAYLIAVSTGMNSRKLIDGDITIDGASVLWSSSISSSISSWNHWAEVTSLVKTKIDASAAGLINFFITENSTSGIDGEILAVIFDDPGQTDRNTVILFFGAQNVAGDDFYIRYAEPLNLNDPKFRLDFSLGISFGYQNNGTQQYSIIDVNGKRLTTSAGGEDDGVSSNGGLITVGGIGDVNTNPVNPNATPTTWRDDDELYNLIPFVAQGDTITHIFNRNPSNDDNIFFAALFSSVTSIVGEGILLSPDVDTNFIGTKDTLIAKVQNNLGVPVVGRKVVFEIVSGPHAGIKDSSFTNSLGNAIFTYTGVTIGQDEIVAKMINLSGIPMSSNLAYHFWKKVNTNTPPTTNPVSISNPNSATPTIGWTYSDVDGNPQIQYEVEVWTGANGTGSNFWDPAVGNGIISSVIYSGSSLVNGQRYYARVRANDGTSWGGWSEASWIATLDLQPVAEAGPNQNVSANASCNASVTLDGTGSYDPDGGTLISYTWSGPGGPWTGATPVVTLSSGRNKINLTVVDNEGNSAADSVIITVSDSLAPIPDVTNLPAIKGLCSVNLSRPTATDNCSGIITATTTDSLSYTTQGTRTVRWTYTDANGNKSYQNQTVIVKDTTKPVPLISSLPVLKGECSVTISVKPQALDNCSGTITASTSDPLTYTSQGNHEIHWIYDDGNGNIANQVQIITVDDTTKPVAESATLPVLRSDCGVILTRPYANDICAGRLAGTTPGSLSINSQGTFNLVWSYDDGNGNVLTQNQTVIIKDTIAPVFINSGSDTSALIKESKLSIALNIDSATATDNCSKTIIGASRSDGLPLDTSFFEGTTIITWTACDTNGNCDSITRNVTVKRNKAPVLAMPPDTSILEGQIISLQMSASDPDGAIPEIFMDSCPVPYLFTINNNGTAAVELRPGCNDHGIYNIRFSATDNIDTVQKTLVLTIRDVNFDPVFDTTGYYVAREMQSFIATIKVFDCDGTIPEIRIKNPPQGSQFIDNHNGTATLTWTPDADDNGYYLVIFEANDGHITVKDTIVLEVKDINAWPPVLTLSATDTTFPINQQLLINAKAEDKDGTPPVLKVTGLPSGAAFTTDNLGNGIFVWTPRDTGTFSFTVTARDLVDSTSFVSKLVTIRVNNQNVSGPVFDPQTDLFIDQNQMMELTIKAVDPDGTIPILSLISKPKGATFKDNLNGTGTIHWNPDCNVSGTFTFTAAATDGLFSDSLNIRVNVRDVNCAPVLYSIPDVNAERGELIRFEVEAYDPDNDTAALLFSVLCDLPGFTFTIKDGRTGVFSWYANYSSGSYPVKFYATDGLLSDSIECRINVDKTGSVKIFGYPQGTKIFALPSGSYGGEYLGQDSVIFSAIPGNYFFQMQSVGYRTSRFVCNVKADTVTAISRTLKPAIPLMLAPAETLGTRNGILNVNKSFAVADVNGDGILDISCLTNNDFSAYTGTDTGSLIFRADPLANTNPVKMTNPFYHLFADWNNDRKYDCIYSDHSGNILFINTKKQSVDTIVKISGTRTYPLVYDIDKDHKKDLIVHSEGIGVFAYLNKGTDAMPLFQSATECTDSIGAPVISMQGPIILLDLDGDGNDEAVAHANGALRIFKTGNQFEKFTLSEDLNCAGNKFTSDSCCISIIGSARGIPGLLMRDGSKLLVFFTRLRGDINGDKTVDIRDITEVSRKWEMIDSNLNWNPLCNLTLSTSGSEVIDIRDISRVSKCWELKEEF